MDGPDAPTTGENGPAATSDLSDDRLLSTEKWSTDPQSGQSRFGRYLILCQLGEGGYGRVFLGLDEELNREVAIKIPKPDRIRQPSDAKSYLAEARTVASLDHPNIVPVLDVGRTTEGLIYVVSKYIDGPTLSGWTTARRPTYEEAARLIAIIARALHHAHERRLVHRDIKPSNILIDARSGTPYIADFGLAVRDDQFSARLETAGTPAYMSPEQARNEGHRLDGRSDVFSLGVVFYELLTGKRPFRGTTSQELVHQISHLEPSSPRELEPSVPLELSRICLKAVSKRVSHRYASALEFAEDLERWRQGPDSEPREQRIVPRGLRSFTADDADFFLDLLPGPRDREGLPESIRFWRTRIEQSDPAATFATGLIYGPSGCGKSSLVKAGLLPRLSPEIIAIYVEATALKTEEMILRSLRKRIPELAGSTGLVDSLKQLRSGTGRKVVIVLDQFEQWLHAHRSEQNTDLVSALRQCDGGRLQAIIMVRDDFAMAASRFMQALETPIVEGHNFAVVDLFDSEHAARVLTKIGQAYGRLPMPADQLSEAQRDFVASAAASLSRGGRVVPVRLALFAEMVKHKAWVPETLREFGGMEGIGVNFLDETFVARTANPDHRRIEPIARVVLAALLPESGAEIKGHLRSETELREIAGLQERPQEFTELLRILDGELRLITPADPEGLQSGSKSGDGDKFYQLTHDYLVPSLRNWLTRKQRETLRGRAELKLADRAAHWNERREARRLPVWWEWLQIRVFTRSSAWTGVQREMMRRAAGRLAVRASLLATALITLSILAWETVGRTRAQSKLDALLHAPIANVPTLIREMRPYRRWLDSLLKRELESAKVQRRSVSQLNLSLALLPVDNSQASYLITRLLAGTPAEVDVIRRALGPQAPELAPRLWDLVSAPETDGNQKLRAACFLGATFPTDERWPAIAPDVLQALVADRTILLGDWARLLQPVGPALLPSLVELLVTERNRDGQSVLAELYAEFAAGDPRGFEPLESVLTGAGNDEQTSLEQAQRKAAAATALAISHRWDLVWPLLRRSSDPTIRSLTIERLGAAPLDSDFLVQSLREDPEVGVRTALVLILADLGAARLPVLLQDVPLLDALRELRDRDTDPGTRGAALWLLNHWNKSDSPAGDSGALLFSRMVAVPSGMLKLRDSSGKERILQVEQPFELALHEVTVDEFLKFRPEHSWDRRSAPSTDCPVNEVSWYDAAAFCNWLSGQALLDEREWCYEPNERGEYGPGMKIREPGVGRIGYRLPTISEWEYACRAGSVTSWSWGEAEELLPRYAWAMANSGVRSHPVGRLRPNDLGIFDLHGNVWEWCQDAVDDLGQPAAREVFVGEETVSGGHRPLRGGTFLNDAQTVASSSSIWNPPGNHTGADGFRVARTLPRSPAKR